MKITQDVRDYAAQQGIENISIAVEHGLKETAQEFNDAGAQIYQKV